MLNPLSPGPAPSVAEDRRLSRRAAALTPQSNRGGFGPQRKKADGASTPRIVKGLGVKGEEKGALPRGPPSVPAPPQCPGHRAREINPSFLFHAPGPHGVPPGNAFVVPRPARSGVPPGSASLGAPLRPQSPPPASCPRIRAAIRAAHKSPLSPARPCHTRVYPRKHTTNFLGEFCGFCRKVGFHRIV
jgi:hypothetical protein